MKLYDRGRGSSVLLTKAAVKVIHFVVKSSLGSDSILGRWVIVGYGLQTLPDVIRVVGGEILLKLVPVFGLTGLDSLFCCISRFLVFVFVFIYVRILFRL